MKLLNFLFLATLLIGSDIVAQKSNNENSNYKKVIEQLDSCFQKKCLSVDELKNYAAAHIHEYKIKLITWRLFDRLSDGHLKKAEKALDMAFQMDLKDNEALFLKAILEKEKGNNNAAEIFNKLIDNVKNTYGFKKPINELAEIFFEEDRYKELIELLSKYKHDSESFEIFFNSLIADGDEIKTTKVFYEILENARDSLFINSFYMQAEPIAEKDETVAWAALKLPNAKISFLKKFWQKRNPTLTRDSNPRLVEHYKRLQYARQFYYKLGNPGYDDRGLIYIRRGKPDRWYVNDELTNLSWVYEDDKNPAHFDFVSSEFGEYKLGNIGGSVVDRAHLHPFYQKMAQKYLMWNLAASRDKKRLMEEINQQMSAELIRMEFYESKKISYIFSPNTPHLPVNIRFASFKKTIDTTTLDISIAIPVSELIFHQNQSEITVRIKAFDSDFVEQETQGKNLTLSSQFKNEMHLVSAFSLKLKPNRYRIALEVANNNEEKQGIYYFDLDVRDFQSRELMVSDIDWATRIENLDYYSGIVKEHANVKIIPYPFTKFQHHQTLSLYYEIYNLTLDNNGHSQYEVSYSINPKKNFFGKLFGAIKKSVNITTPKQGSSIFEFEYITLDLSNLEKGEADFILRVYDKISKQQIDHRETVFIE
ncbi:GWxTD domain-containing protein [bacterium]|nr:GWxTD domain-containing protein [bacterium]